jgi:poly-D-alanine transfer protein DltD
MVKNDLNNLLCEDGIHLSQRGSVLLGSSVDKFITDNVRFKETLSK